MYLHLGQSVVVPDRDIIGIFDLDNASYSHLTRGFLERAEREGPGGEHHRGPAQVLRPVPGQEGRGRWSICPSCPPPH